jgi:OPA family glycerol-3-phosphate transporter-like MFS transporter
MTAGLRDSLVEGKIAHPAEYRMRRFFNWFPLGISYALLYMGRYNLNVAASKMEQIISKADFGNIFGFGTIVYGCAFVINGPLTDRIGGKRAMLIAMAGAALANCAIGMLVYANLTNPGGDPARLKLAMGALYGINMYFQSFGAVAIVKVNSSWFHVRERGGFSGIFGVMISSGIFFAYDGNRWILKQLSAGLPAGSVTPSWFLFFAPGVFLAAMFALELLVLRDRPSQAGHQDIETGEATLGDDEHQISVWTIFRRVLTHPVVLTVALIEFCTGVLRQGVQNWYFLYADDQIKAAGGIVANGAASAPARILELAPASELAGWKFTYENWGLIQFAAGILGANLAGWVSDRFFNSRRAPAAGLLYAVLIAGTAAMNFFLFQSWVLCALSFCNILAVIGIHGLLSGTASMDFGGRRGTATAVGIIDGFVYLGTGFQSVTLGYLIENHGWRWWPPFLLPFAVIGFLLLCRIWNAMPRGRKAH